MPRHGQYKGATVCMLTIALLSLCLLVTFVLLLRAIKPLIPRLKKQRVVLLVVAAGVIFVTVVLIKNSIKPIGDIDEPWSLEALRHEGKTDLPIKIRLIKGKNSGVVRTEHGRVLVVINDHLLTHPERRQVDSTIRISGSITSSVEDVHIELSDPEHSIPGIPVGETVSFTEWLTVGQDGIINIDVVVEKGEDVRLLFGRPK